MILGSIVAMVTPMNSRGDIDFCAIRRLVGLKIENSTDGIVAVGTTGEPTTLTMDEHSYIINTIVNEVKGRIPVIAGTGANATLEAIDLARYAKEAGADYCLSVTPYYNRPTQEGIYQHLKAVAEIGLPVIMYNVPKRTSVDLDYETVLRLVEIDCIVGIKEASCDLKRASELISNLKVKEFAIYSGDDSTACEFLLAGCNGVISVSSNIVPHALHELCLAAVNCNYKSVQKRNPRMMQFNSVLCIEANPITVKWFLKNIGLVDTGIRLPLTVFKNKSTVSRGG